MWRYIYQSCSTESEPATIAEFFSQQTFEKIWTKLNLDAPFQTYDTETREFLLMMNLQANEISMWDNIRFDIDQIIQKGKDITLRYSSYLEPKIFAAITELIESRFFTCLQDLAQLHDRYLQRDNLPEHFDKRPLLVNWSGCFPDIDDLNNLKTIHHWVDAKYSFYEKFDSKITRDQRYKNFRYEKRASGTETPLRMIDPNLAHGHVKPVITATY